jgi:hypothetical protein
LVALAVLLGRLDGEGLLDEGALEDGVLEDGVLDGELVPVEVVEPLLGAASAGVLLVEVW